MPVKIRGDEKICIIKTEGQISSWFHGVVAFLGYLPSVASIKITAVSFLWNLSTLLSEYSISCLLNWLFGISANLLKTNKEKYSVSFFLLPIFIFFVIVVDFGCCVLGGLNVIAFCPLLGFFPTFLR